MRVYVLLRNLLDRDTTELCVIVTHVVQSASYCVRSAHLPFVRKSALLSFGCRTKAPISMLIHESLEQRWNTCSFSFHTRITKTRS